QSFALEGVEGVCRETLIMLIQEQNGGMCLIVTPTEQEASETAANIAALGGNAVLFPSWGAAPYHPVYGASPVFAHRAAILCDIAMGKPPPVIVMPERLFLSPFVPPDSFQNHVITFHNGDELDTAITAEKLTALGYTRVAKSQMAGEFVLRGEVLDIITPNGTYAYRILFDFNKIESIRLFDPTEQTYISNKNYKEIMLPPLKELIWSNERIEILAENLAVADEFRNNGKTIIDQLKTKKNFSGEEMFFSMSFKKPATIASYLHCCTDSFVVFLERERLENADEALRREYEASFRAALRDDPSKEFPAPCRLLLPFGDIVKNCPRTVSFYSIKNKSTASNDKSVFSIQCDPPCSFFGNINYMKEALQTLVEQDWYALLACETDVQTARIASLFHGAGKAVHKGVINAITLPISSGFSLPEIKLIVIAESEIFGRRARPPQSLKTAQSKAIDSFIELNQGDYVVHINYGIGLFLGIERVKALGNERDYIKLRYADDEIVFVPVEQANLVQRYIGSEGSAPALDKLGAKMWEARKERARKAAEELAARLITLYSKRKAARGFAFPADTEWQTMFEASFPYEETADQLRCVEEIKTDMEKPEPMDRLVCGDVGYGKTEVAMRACFKAVMGGKQAAFLAPTTILAEQHFENFKQRFMSFPVRIEMLSRFVEDAAVRKILSRLKCGEVDILIGTHRIIQNDVVFKDMGLLIIDEEQRFGVRDKERLKEFKHSVDCLALSATPIPRTLHMSLLKIRDMSLLVTPPRNRRPIETHIGEYDETIIAQAIRTEAARGGQVFFLHNKIESLSDIRLKLEQLIPELIFETAHGRMEPAKIEDVMRRFVQGGFHALVSTTIIENGIDIPNVNTIIIDRADMYGIAQLYQLRGRVGRSDKPAFAYLFYPKDHVLSELAMKRLEAVSDLTELGSGFKIAMKDMEIRGAGNLLGREQSGSIYSVGFDMYLRLLDNAIQKLQNEKYEAETETLLELEYTGFIPDSYISGAQEKMEVYKKIASVQTQDDLDSAHAMLHDRFGPPPLETAALLALAEIRIICKQLAVLSLKERAGVVRVEFARVANINIERALRLVKESAGRIRIDPRAPNILILQTGSISLSEKSAFVCEKLSALI
ncbi:MAG: transcription-repair coupling factor, partial [Spirochaetaceae bacterium]|nr:transcription-repair coupling factor [Spirochaetaceae bacterium]